MKRKYYALFMCNEWKERSSMDLIGLFTENKLRKVIIDKVKKKEFEYSCDIEEIKTREINYINGLLVYGYIQEITINELI